MDSVSKIASDYSVSISEEEGDEDNLRCPFPSTAASPDCLGIFAGEVYPRSVHPPPQNTSTEEDEEEAGDEDSSDGGNHETISSPKKRDRSAENGLVSHDRKAKRFRISRRRPDYREGSRLPRRDSDGADLGFPESTAGIEFAGRSDAVDAASPSQAEKEPCFFTAPETLNSSDNVDLAASRYLVCEIPSPPSRGNAGNAAASERKSMDGQIPDLWKCSGASPGKVASRDLMLAHASQDPPSTAALEDPVFENPQSDVGSINYRIGFRTLPPSIQGPPRDDMGIREDAVVNGIGEKKGNLTVKKLMDAMAVLSKVSDGSIRDEGILEVARRAGYIFPRPRWWRPGGYL